MAISIDNKYKQLTKNDIFTITKIAKTHNATWITVQSGNTVLTYGIKAFKTKYEKVKD